MNSAWLTLNKNKSSCYASSNQERKFCPNCPLTCKRPEHVGLPEVIHQVRLILDGLTSTRQREQEESQYGRSLEPIGLGRHGALDSGTGRLPR